MALSRGRGGRAGGARGAAQCSKIKVVQWNLRIKDTLGSFKVSSIKRCPLFRGKIIHQSIRMGLKQVSFIERCPLFRGSFIGGSTVILLIQPSGLSRPVRRGGSRGFVRTPLFRAYSPTSKTQSNSSHVVVYSGGLPVLHAKACTTPSRGAHVISTYVASVPGLPLTYVRVLICLELRLMSTHIMSTYVMSTHVINRAIVRVVRAH